jgi:hypothetical protein
MSRVDKGVIMVKMADGEDVVVGEGKCKHHWGNHASLSEVVAAIGSEKRVKEGVIITKLVSGETAVHFWQRQ